jgi:probable phosphoglycerate mutase
MVADEGRLPPLAKPLLKSSPETAGFKDGWKPSDVKVAMNITLDASFVPATANALDLSSMPGAPRGCRASVSRVVALDNLIDDEALRSIKFCYGTFDARYGSYWERRTADDDVAKPTWGLRQFNMDLLVNEITRGEDPDNPNPFKEFHSRLQALYPDWIICHMPAESLVAPEGETVEDDDEHTGKYKCESFVANAAVFGDEYRWHVDADPSSFPDECEWVKTYGDYVNGEPGKPLFVSAIIYPNETWKEDEWGAETHFTDKDSGVGAMVAPRPGRVVLIDQDVTQRVSPPSRAAGERARYSLVYKLVFFPRNGNGNANAELWERGIARPEWGVPSPIGSAAKLAAIVNAAARRAGGVKREREDE